MNGWYWPKFESEFLSEIAASMQKRSKALEHKVQTFRCDRVWEQGSDGRIETMELCFEISAGSGAKVKITFWHNRFVWIDVHRFGGQQETFQAQHEGRIGNVGSKILQEAVFATVLKQNADLPEADRKTWLDEIWRDIALSGVQGIVGRSDPA